MPRTRGLMIWKRSSAIHADEVLFTHQASSQICLDKTGRDQRSYTPSWRVRLGNHFLRLTLRILLEDQQDLHTCPCQLLLVPSFLLHSPDNPSDHKECDSECNRVLSNKLVHYAPSPKAAMLPIRVSVGLL